MKASASLSSALTLLCATGILLRAESPGVYALRDARIVRVSAPVIERGTVVLRDGLIESVGESITPPAGAWVIDCKGLTVYPGLIDALTTLGIPGAVLPATTQDGETQTVPTTAPPASRTPTTATRSQGPQDRPLNTSWSKAADQIAPTERGIQIARDGGYTSAVTFPGAGIFAGQGSVINLAGDRAGDMVIADSVGQFVTLRFSVGRGFPGSLLGSIAYVRQTYLDVEHYKLAKSIYEKHPAGLRRPAYDRALEGVLMSPLALLPAGSEIEIERMVALAKELKLKAVLYGGHEAWRAAELLKQANMPILVSLKYPAKSRDADPAADEAIRILQMREQAPSTAGALAKSGVKFAFYSDGLATTRERMRAVKKAIDAGLSASDAIRAMTLAPAEIYGVESRIGSIDKGKIANLVVADGDLFADQTKIKYVFVDGRKFEPQPQEPAPRPAGRGAAQ